MRYPRTTAMLLAAAACVGGVSIMAQPSAEVILGPFEEGWEAHWETKTYGDRPNTFEVVKDGGDRVLRVDSDDSASGMVYDYRIEPLDTGVLSWRWKVRRGLTESGDEHAGQWVEEERDIVADYTAFFGEPPRRVRGFAVMVDTDQTGVATTAWFDDIVLLQGGGE